MLGRRTRPKLQRSRLPGSTTIVGTWKASWLPPSHQVTFEIDFEFPLLEPCILTGPQVICWCSKIPIFNLRAMEVAHQSKPVVSATDHCTPVSISTNRWPTDQNLAGEKLRMLLRKLHHPRHRMHSWVLVYPRVCAAATWLAWQPRRGAWPRQFFLPTTYWYTGR